MYENIKEQFREVIRHSQGIPNPQIDDLFDRWADAKSKFIERFGGLIYEWPEPIEFTLDVKERNNRVMEFASTVSDTFNNPVLAEFIDENLDSFFENKVSKSLGENIPVGMKLLKAFKYFEPNKAALRNIQDMASQIIQENKIKGTLCFSVHPLDFLSSSENTYNWRSCHALDGEYRAGNLCYMADDCTFMVYLKGADNVHLPAFGDVKWNSKKWRMLIHASSSDEIMFAGRQYPFSSKHGIDIVLNIYNTIFQGNERYPFSYPSNKYHSWSNEYISGYVPEGCGPDAEAIELEDKYLIISNRLVGLTDIVKQTWGALNYNDILQSTCYIYPYYAILNPYGYHSITAMTKNPIWVGGEVVCLHCGKICIGNSETMRCDECETQYGYEENDTWGNCANCGTRMYLDDAHYIGDDEEAVCGHCFEHYCFVCDCCGETHYNTNRHFVSTEDKDMFMCNRCFYDYENDEEE